MVSIPVDTLIGTAYRRVVPLYSFDERGRPFLLGSSVPFQIDSMRFLVSAAHCCFRDRKPIPLFVYGETKPHALTELRGAWDYSEGENPDVDVAVILLGNECADDLQALHWFCGPNDVCQVMPKTPGVHYLIAGYPASRNRNKPVQYGLPCKATALITGDIIGVGGLRGVDKTDKLHFAINFPHKKVAGPGGREFHVPSPYGMSGGGVWRVEIDTARRLANKPCLVGIGIEYYKNKKAFLATQINAIEALVVDLFDPKIPTNLA